MPPPLLTFDGINSAQSLCGCFPPDTNGDVGPNHYVETTNVSIKIFDKNGNTLSGPTSFNSFFAPLRQRLAATQTAETRLFSMTRLPIAG